MVQKVRPPELGDGVYGESELSPHADFLREVMVTLTDTLGFEVDSIPGDNVQYTFDLEDVPSGRIFKACIGLAEIGRARLGIIIAEWERTPDSRYSGTIEYLHMHTGLPGRLCVDIAQHICLLYIYGIQVPRKPEGCIPAVLTDLFKYLEKFLCELTPVFEAMQNEVEDTQVLAIAQTILEISAYTEHPTPQ